MTYEPYNAHPLRTTHLPPAFTSTINPSTVIRDQHVKAKTIMHFEGRLIRSDGFGEPSSKADGLGGSHTRSSALGFSGLLPATKSSQAALFNQDVNNPSSPFSSPNHRNRGEEEEDFGDSQMTTVEETPRFDSGFREVQMDEDSQMTTIEETQREVAAVAVAEAQGQNLESTVEVDSPKKRGGIMAKLQRGAGVEYLSDVVEEDEMDNADLSAQSMRRNEWMDHPVQVDYAVEQRENFVYHTETLAVREKEILPEDQEMGYEKEIEGGPASNTDPIAAIPPEIQR